jgi:dienelactone hydrolase
MFYMADPIRAPERNFSPWRQWIARLQATVTENAFPVGKQEEYDCWVQRRRELLHELLGRMPERVPLNFERLESVECDGYRREKVVFDTEDTMSVPAYLLIPDGRHRPGPAVLAIHGHGPGKSHVCGLTRTPAPNGDYALQLVRRGYVVLAPDLRCFGERLDEMPADHYACDTNLVHAVMAGCNPLTQNLWDMARSLDVLEQHPLVDPGRLGVVGLSYGGTVSLFLAAYDERVAAAVISGYLSSWQASHAVPLNMCGSQILFGSLGRLEHLDVAALVAPRPMLVESGTEDPIFPFGAATETVAQLRVLYDHLGAGQCLEHDVFSGGHQWHGELAYPFLAHHLGLNGSEH